MTTTENKANDLVSGKFYVLDQFSSECARPVAGPFDTREQAEAERVQLNIADDCFVARKK